MRQGRFITAGLAALAAVAMAPGVAAAAAPFVDDTAAEFGAGTPGSSTQVTAAGSVELARVMKPQDLTTWSITPWGTGTPAAGTNAVVGGVLTLDGARATAPRPYSAAQVSQTLEFTAKFGAASNQHVGFGNTVDTNGPGSTYDDGPWAMFSTKDSGGATLYARTLPGTAAAGGAQETAVPAPFDPAASHKYKIVWTATNVAYFVDDQPVAVDTHTATITANMRPAASDYAAGTPDTPTLQLSSASLSLYADTGAFQSRVFDAGDARTVRGS